MSQFNEAPAAYIPQPAATEAVVETTIRRIGNGAFLPLTQALLRPLGVGPGQAVRVTVKGGVLTMAPVDGAYEATRRAAAAARGRYPRALDILGR